MPFIGRETALRRLRKRVASETADHRRRRRHRHLGEVRRARRRRPHHHLQLGPLPHGRARQPGRACSPTATPTPSSSTWRARCCRSCATRRCSPGVCGTDPFRLMPGLSARAEGHGLRRRAELSHRRPHRRRVPAEPRRDGHELRPRSRDDSARLARSGCSRARMSSTPRVRAR